MIAPNPFTPQSGWEPRFFGGRETELRFFEEVLKNSLNLRPSHVIVSGDWGIGKTSLLKQYKKIAQDKRCLAAYCPVTEFNANTPLSNAINLISEEMLSGFPVGEPKEYFGEKRQSGKKTTSQPQVQFTKFLLNLWQHLDTKLAVVLLDDVQNFSLNSGIIDVLRSVLSKDEILENSNYLFVLSSTAGGWQNFVDKHNPVGRFFRKRVILDNLTPQETISTINHSLKNSGVQFSAGLKNKVCQFTKGHPYEIQLLCSHLYDFQIEGKVEDRVFKKAFRNALDELGKDYFETLYRRSSEREKEILIILAEKEKPLKIADIRSIMITEKRVRNFPISNIKNFLYRLHDKELIKRKDTGEFEILDPMFSKYIMLYKKGE
jgi:hypothetical protein